MLFSSQALMFSRRERWCFLVASVGVFLVASVGVFLVASDGAKFFTFHFSLFTFHFSLF